MEVQGLTSFYQSNMKYAEKKISLVGWGELQVMLHVINGTYGVSVVEDNRITRFGLTPWLKGRVAVVPTTAHYAHASRSITEHADLILNMRGSAFIDAISAIEHKDIYLMAEAITTTYMAQHYMGAEHLPNRGELAKRFSGRFGVYLFDGPHAMTKDIKSNSVVAA